MSEKLKKILYVEDDEDIAQIVLMTLGEFGGFEIKHSICGKDALKELPKFMPQLVLMDMMMPEMDGLTVLKEMKNINKIKNIPVIFVTAKMQEEEQKTYMEAGAIGVIVKPFDPVTLSDQVNAMWKKKGGK